MSVTIKSAREIELMRAAGKILAKVHQNLGEALRPGCLLYTSEDCFFSSGSIVGGTFDGNNEN